MKRDVTQTGCPSPTPETYRALETPATQRFSQQNTAPHVYTMDELRNMPRPPGDYSGVHTGDCPAAAEFFQNGTVPDKADAVQYLSLFCIKNRFADALSYLWLNTGFEWLNIYLDNDYTGMASFICEWVANIDFEIKLGFTDIQHDEDAQHISQMLLRTSTITGLNIKLKNCAPESEVKILNSLHFNTALRELEVTKISGSGIKILCSVLNWNSTIEHLAIFKASLNDDIAIPFCNCISVHTSLISLAIAVIDISRLMPILSKAIEKNTCLKSLKLACPEWSLDSTHAFAAALGKNKHLSSVHIESTYFYNDFYEDFGELCDFDHNAAAVLFEELESNTTLTSLKFNYCQIGDQISAALKNFISNNKTLIELKLYNCHIGSQSAKAIAEALPTNTSLRSLDIGGNRGFEVDGWSQIIKSCKTQCPLTTLKLCRVADKRTYFGQHDFPVADLVEMIQFNTTLEVLDLSCYSSECESFTIDQLRQISTALNSNHSLINFILHDEDQLSARKRECENFSLQIDRTVKFAPHDEQFIMEIASNITRFQQYDFECNEIAGKVGANAEAQRLRFVAMQGLATLVPYLPLELIGLIVDNLILLNHEAPEKSGLEAMRSLQKIAEKR